MGLLSFLKGVRRVGPLPSPTLFLTFDDGPDPVATPQILELLKSRGVPATFFCVADRASKAPGLLEEMKRAGHALGNHSLDHRYGAYFQGRRAMMAWVRKSEEDLSSLWGGPTVGFRPPAGIRTPELAWALKHLELPMILWSDRFFDTTIPWTPTKALKGAERMKPGGIVLLHDRKKEEKIRRFLEALGLFIDSAREKGFRFNCLSRELCLGEVDFTIGRSHEK